MNTNQKFQALNALVSSVDEEASLGMDVNGDWYVHLPGLEIKHGAILSGVGCHYDDAYSAIEHTWNRLTDGLKKGEYLLLRAMDEKKRHAYKWNGFMWETLDEKAYK